MKEMNISTEEANNNNGNWARGFWHKLKGVLKLRRSTLKESLDDVLDEHTAAGEVIEPEEKELLHNVLNFSELKVGDVMVPRTDIISVSHNATIDELQELITKEAHTRLPVSREDLDDVMGFIHLKDLVIILSNNEPFKIKEIIRQILFVPPSMRIMDLLANMRMSRVHMAIVVDEYGGTAGLVTMEDLMEEIVGEIRDEHDDEEKPLEVKQLGKGIMEVNARIDIKGLEQKLGMQLITEEEEDYDTLGGMLFSMLGRVPVMNEVVAHPSGLEFEIAEADLRRIKRVIIRKNIHNNKLDKSPNEENE